MRDTEASAFVPIAGSSDFTSMTIYLLRRKLLVLLLAVSGAAAGYAFSYVFPPQYKANATLIPSDEILGLNTSGLLNNLGGLASLVGMGGTSNKQSEAVETLKSRALATQFIEVNNLLPVLFKDKWDAIAGKWKIGVRGTAPTLADGYRLFDKNIRSVIENRKSGLVEISITWTDARLAKEWLFALVNSANDLLRMQALERSDKNLKYLKQASESTNVMEVKTAIYKLMETEIKKQMVAFGGRDYAFRFVDPPVIPERKIFPSRLLFTIMGSALFIALLFIVFGFTRIQRMAAL